MVEEFIRERASSSWPTSSTAPKGRASTSSGCSATSPASACSTSGAATARAAVTFAQQGAIVIAIDTSEARHRARASRAASEAEVKRRVARRRPRRPRVPARRLDRRRVQRVRGRRGRRLRPPVPAGAARAQAQRPVRVLATRTRSRCASTTARVARSVLRPRAGRWSSVGARRSPRTPRSLERDVHRSLPGRVPRRHDPRAAPTTADAPVPSTVVWRARKEGA